MGIRCDFQSPMGTTRNLKASGLLAHVIWMRVPRVRDEEYPQCISACFVLSEDECHDVGMRMLAEIQHAESDLWHEANAYGYAINLANALDAVCLINHKGEALFS